MFGVKGQRQGQLLHWASVRTGYWQVAKDHYLRQSLACFPDIREFNLDIARLNPYTLINAIDTSAVRHLIGFTSRTWFWTIPGLTAGRPCAL
jgi:hypothetical protein